MNRLDIEKHSNNYEKLLNRIVKNARLNANSVYVKNIEIGRASCRERV